MKKVLMAVVLVGLTACGPSHEGIPSAQVASRFDPQTKAHFNSFKRNFIDKFCLSCHQPGRVRGGVDMSSLDAIFESKKVLLRPGEPDESLIYTTVLEGSMPPREVLSMELTNALKSWIETWPEAGAQKEIPN